MQVLAADVDQKKQIIHSFVRRFESGALGAVDDKRLVIMDFLSFKDQTL